MYKVEKKSGEVQDFDRNKILVVVIKAGGTKEEAEKVLTAIEAWLPTAAVNGVVKSEQIRVKGLEILRGLNPNAADNYTSYRK